MNICYKRSNGKNKQILKIKYNRGYKGSEYIKETKIKKTNIRRKYLKEDKRKVIGQDRVDKMKIFQVNGCLKNKVGSLINKNLSKNKSYSKQGHNFLIFLILFIKLKFLLYKCNQENFIFKLSEVIIRINATGNVTILSDYFFQRYNPCQIYINDSLYHNITNKYYFNNSGNITIKIEWNNTIESTAQMFKDCNKTFEIIFSNFNTSKITNMSSMFYDCRSLISLDLSNFDTSQVVNMDRMFVRCLSLTSLNIINFNTSQVSNMVIMFHNYLKLETLDISHFITSKVNNMSFMFYGCSSLNSLNLSNFDTSQVIDMNKMFYECSGLIELDLSNFNTSQVKSMDLMFYSCSKLKKFNL